MTTREERLKLLSTREPPHCPRCANLMKLCKAPENATDEGYGWGEFIWACVACKKPMGSLNVFWVQSIDESIPVFMVLGHNNEPEPVNFDLEQKRAQKTDHLRVLEIHAALDTLLFELSGLNQKAGTVDNPCYVKTIQSFLTQILRNYMGKKGKQG